MRAHLRYLKYVVLHKLYVLRAGLAIAKRVGIPVSWPAWVWRLLIHDRSKFSRAEWSPYVASFYGPSEEAWTAERIAELMDFYDDDQITMLEAERRGRAEWLEYKRDVRASFNAAWLHHIHHNPHHWQHHILLEDSGKTIVLVPHAVLVYEMVADWLGAGPKALRSHSIEEAVTETIVWYAANHRQMQMREIVRQTAELVLIGLADYYGITHAAQEIESAARARASLVIPGR